MDLPKPPQHTHTGQQIYKPNKRTKEKGSIEEKTKKLGKGEEDIIVRQ
jgi:hypothetical protein